MLSLSASRPAIWLPRRLSVVTAGLWSFADQGLVSLANFLLMVLLARTLPASEFGAFVLVYMAIYLANNLQTSLITRPHNVLGANLEPGPFKTYTAAVLKVQTGMALSYLALGILATVAAIGFSPALAPLFGATTAAIVAAQFQEFSRQVQYTKGNAAEAFRYDLIGYGGQIVLLSLMLAAGVLTGFSTMAGLAMTSAAAAAYALRRIAVLPHGPGRAVLAHNWGMARWLLGDNLGQWLSSMLFPILTAAFAGTAATAAYRMLQNLVAPLHVIFQAIPSFAASRATRAYHNGGQGGLLRFMLPMTLAVGLPVGLYLSAISLYGRQAMDLMYGAGHSEHANLIWLFGAAYLAQYLIAAVSVALLATNNARATFVGRLAAIALTLTVGVAATALFGLEGALAGVFITNLGLLLVLGAYVGRIAGRGPSRRDTGMVKAGGIS